ncbi:MAG: hypothetical protein IT579_12105 [Verrucomicrobia subdivision 3 bacterium]|nr:hypothetical protein [Limisphaerales bacterium]
MEVIKSLLQMGAAGILLMAGWGMLRFLREERADRAAERNIWFQRFDRVAAQLEALAREVTTAIQHLRHDNERRNG